jgi:hypothetical protein
MGKKVNSKQNKVNKGLNVPLDSNYIVHRNIEQEYIIITADKLELILRDAKDILISQRDWWTPLGFFSTLLITLLTTDFKNFIFSANVWYALFIIAIVISLLWLVKCLLKLKKHWGKDDVKGIISKIKVESNINKD